MSAELEHVLNSGINHTRSARSSVFPEKTCKEIASALEDLFIALAITNECELDPATERNSYAAVQNPVLVEKEKTYTKAEVKALAGRCNCHYHVPDPWPCPIHDL